MARFFAFFRLFHLSLTLFFDRRFPLKELFFLALADIANVVGLKED